MVFSRFAVRALVRNSLLLILLISSGRVRAQVQFQPYEVHIGYVISSNRQAQPNAVADLHASIVAIQGWYADQMNR
jgi:hypothetical protein